MVLGNVCGTDVPVGRGKRNMNIIQEFGHYNEVVRELENEDRETGCGVA